MKQFVFIPFLVGTLQNNKIGLSFHLSKLFVVYLLRPLFRPGTLSKLVIHQLISQCGVLNYIFKSPINLVPHTLFFILTNFYVVGIW